MINFKNDQHEKLAVLQSQLMDEYWAVATATVFEVFTLSMLALFTYFALTIPFSQVSFALGALIMVNGIGSYRGFYTYLLIYQSIKEIRQKIAKELDE